MSPQLADAQAARGRGALERKLRADDLADRARVRRETLDLAAARRRERLAQVEQSLRPPRLPPADRDEDTDHGSDDDARDREPPAVGEPRPERAEIDLALCIGIGSEGAYLAHRAATLATAHSHWARKPSSSSVLG